MKIRIYTLQGCPPCRNAKSLLHAKSVQYEEVDITEHTGLFNKIKADYNIRTVPQIFVMDEEDQHIYHIKGYDELRQLESNRELNNILDQYGIKHT